MHSLFNMLCLMSFHLRKASSVIPSFVSILLSGLRSKEISFLALLRSWKIACCLTSPIEAPLWGAKSHDQSWQHKSHGFPGNPLNIGHQGRLPLYNDLNSFSHILYLFLSFSTYCNFFKRAHTSSSRDWLSFPGCHPEKCKTYTQSASYCEAQLLAQDEHWLVFLFA